MAEPIVMMGWWVLY